MSERNLIPISAHPKIGKINEADYFRLYERSLADPDGFWGEQGKRIDWIKPYRKIGNSSFTGDVSIRWYEDGTLNASANCIDRHLAKRADQTAILWEGDDPSEDRRVTYRELHESVCRLANALKARGVKKGDRVTIYLPMIPEAAVAMLACARIGAIHSVVFGGFSPDSLAGRIEDCRSTVLITADEGLRGGRKVPLKRNADTALRQCPEVKTVIVVKRTGGDIDWTAGRDHWYHEVCAAASPECPPEEMSAEDPLFILYTSGSTGKPKGVLHTTGGYLVYTAMTHEYVFDYRDGEIYWCTADVGWVTGHSYIVYGPLANGATTVMFEGVPNYPDPSRFWQVVDKHKISIFYTAPTAIRALMREGEDHVRKTSRKSLRLLGTVGEPINPEAWLWYYDYVGDKRCPIVDTWWQTETGGILITPLPGATKLKPGSGIRPTVTNVDLRFHNDNSYNETPPHYVGLLCHSQSKEGGTSKVISFYSAHNRLLEEHGNVLPRLYRPFWYDRHREFFPGDPDTHAAPVFANAGDRLTARLALLEIHGGYALRGEAMDREGEAALEAMDAVMRIPGLAIDLQFKPGQIQYVNNRTTGHMRTAFVDGDAPDQKRLLTRLWLRDSGRQSYRG